MGGHVLVQQTERVRKVLARQHLQVPAPVTPGELARSLAPAVQHEHAVVAERRREACAGGVGDVVRDVVHTGRVQAG